MRVGWAIHQITMANTKGELIVIFLDEGKHTAYGILLFFLVINQAFNNNKSTISIHLYKISFHFSSVHLIP